MSLPIADILQHLGLTDPTPTLLFLNRLLLGWSRHIPWESASRIARHQRPGTPQDYARCPEVFFHDALTLGTGGTCFESNLALRALLRAVGFEGVLAFCDMKTQTVNPHCAFVVTLEGARYLADVGYPVPAALRLDPHAPTVVETPVYRYHAVPVGVDRWEVWRRSGGFAQLSYWLKGEGVDDATFRARLLRDHEPDGLFLDEVIVQRVDGDLVWRYSEHKGLVRRTIGREEPIALTAAEQADLPAALARRFGMSQALLAAALSRTPPAGVWP